MKNKKPSFPAKNSPSKGKDFKSKTLPPKKEAKKEKLDLDDIELTPDHKESHTINWFPGHMARALREIKTKLSGIDVVIEIRDARLPLHTSNQALEETLGTKGRVIVFNKANMVEPNVLLKWENYFKKINSHHLFINALSKTDVKKIIQVARDLIQERRQKDNPGVELAAKNKIRLMIIGLPNTGKSTVINQLSGRNAAKVADKPGQTQTQQLIKIGNDVELVDTPGIMMPSISSYEHGIWLTLINAIPEDIVGIEKPVEYIVDLLVKHDSKVFKERYGLTDLTKHPDEIIEEVAKARGCIKQKGLLDLERAHRIILTDFRNGDLGKYSFGEIPE